MEALYSVLSVLPVLLTQRCQCYSLSAPHRLGSPKAEGLCPSASCCLAMRPLFANTGEKEACTAVRGARAIRHTEPAGSAWTAARGLHKAHAAQPTLRPTLLDVAADKTEATDGLAAAATAPFTVVLHVRKVKSRQPLVQRADLLLGTAHA